MAITEEQRILSQKEGNTNRAVLVFCDYCGSEEFGFCYKKNVYIKCPNCEEKLHISSATDEEKELYDVDYLAKYRYLTREQRYWHQKKLNARKEMREQKDLKEPILY